MNDPIPSRPEITSLPSGSWIPATDGANGGRLSKISKENLAAVLAALGGGEGGAAAWAAFTGTGTPTLIGSSNILALDHVGTGLYKLHFATTFAAATYGVVFGAQRNSPSSGIAQVCVGLGDETVSVYLPMNGTNGSTSFPDSSLFVNSVTASGDAQVDTSEKQFGSGSLKLSGAGYVTIPAASNMRPAGDFTIRFYFKRSADSVTANGYFFDQDESGGAYLQGYMVMSTHKVRVDCYPISLVSTNAFNDSNWHFVEVTRVGSGTNNVTLRVDGNIEAQDTSTNASWDVADFVIGRNRLSDTHYWKGWIDDFVFINGVGTSAGLPVSAYALGPAKSADYCFIESFLGSSRADVQSITAAFFG